MTEQQEQKIKHLIEKYNDVLIISMRLAVAEDFINLIIINRDDKQFELSNLLKNKNELYTFILKEFMLLNSSHVLEGLKFMDDPTLSLMGNIKKQNRSIAKRR